MVEQDKRTPSPTVGAEIVAWLNGLERARGRVARGEVLTSTREMEEMQARAGLYRGVADDIQAKWPALFEAPSSASPKTGVARYLGGGEHPTESCLGCRYWLVESGVCVECTPAYQEGLRRGQLMGQAKPEAAMPRYSWHEDDGPALWWRFPIEQPPYVGTPLDDDFPGEYVTHWTKLVIPQEPTANAKDDLAEIANMTDAEVDAELRAAGTDPAEAGDMGNAIAFIGKAARFRWPGEQQTQELRRLLAETRLDERRRMADGLNASLQGEQIARLCDEARLEAVREEREALIATFQGWRENHEGQALREVVQHIRARLATPHPLPEEKK